MEIVEELEKMQSPQQLHVTDFPVGLGSRAEELILKLQLDNTDHVLVVAVFGISGIGKTTIVKETYNRIVANFDVSCFLADIHHICQAPNWKIDLPKELISCLTGSDKFSTMSNHNDSITKIKRLVSRRKVLLVLDDVDNCQQLNALGINPSWFDGRSRIIVTTRDKRSLGNIPYVSYTTTLLNRRESLNLFTRLMFSRDDPVSTKFIKDVVGHAGGIPLVLKVWSSHFKHFEKEQWPSVLETLKRIPHGDVQSQLQMSYDSLTNRAKKLFLDIACFFNGYEKDLVVKVLQDEDSSFFPNNEIQYLVDKSLVEIREPRSRLWMQHAIREMGQEIVRKENEDEPGLRSRLWDVRDVKCVLTENLGTKVVQSICLTNFKEEMTESLRKMSSLRLIQLRTNDLPWNNEMTPLSFKQLKYMAWEFFPFNSISYISMTNVVVLRLHHSKLKTLWEGIKCLKKLKVLDVKRSSLLTETGDFFGVENLEELCLAECDNLKELHSSIACLKKLVVLDLGGIYMTLYIDWELIGKLASLQKLILNYNIKAEKDIGPMSLLQLHNLKAISLSFCNYMQSIPNLAHHITSIDAFACKSLVNLPSNMSELKSLKSLWFDMCPKLGSEDPQFHMKIAELTNLSNLCMSGCSLSQVPKEFGNMVNLVELNLSRSTFSSLPGSLSNLSQLVTLRICECPHLRSLPLLPSNLEEIDADECGSLDWMPFDSMQMSYNFRTKACKESRFSKQLVIRLPWKEVPDWCSYKNREAGLSFVAPMRSDKNICGVIIWANQSREPGYVHLDNCTPEILNKTKNRSQRLKRVEIGPDDMCVMFYPLDDTTLVVEAGDNVAVHFPWRSSIKGSNCGLRLIYEGDVEDSNLVIQKVCEPNDIVDYSVDDFNLLYDKLDYDYNYNYNTL